MALAEMNPYRADTPEWQLYENAKGSDLVAVELARDAERYIEQAQAARERAQRFWAALERLAAPADGGTREA